MLMEHSPIADLILMIIGCAGFTLASYIYRRKRAKKPLICPLRTKCELVTQSSYSKFLGIPVEILGMLYYASVVILHGFVVVYPVIFTASTARASLIISTIAFLFSLYLISIQAFVLKQWCTWCICSAMFCVAIFVMTYLSAPIGLF